MMTTHSNDYFDISTNELIKSNEPYISKPTEISKAWGKELIIHNDEEYCGKILSFLPNSKFSMHYHVEKQETWYVTKGSFVLAFINTKDATKHLRQLNVGDTIFIKRGMPHQLIAGAEGGEIFEVSTEHYDSDSYRVEKGDSQL